MFLLGEYQNRIDPRGRAFVPVKFRDQLGSPIYMVLDKRGCVECYNEEGITEKRRELIEKQGGILNSQTSQSAFFAFGDTQPIDNQGRIIIKGDYIEKMGADKDIVFLGAYDHFEIWAKDKYDAMKKEVSSITDEVGELENLEERIRLLEKKRELMERKKALEKEIEELG